MKNQIITRFVIATLVLATTAGLAQLTKAPPAPAAPPASPTKPVPPAPPERSIDETVFLGAQEAQRAASDAFNKAREVFDHARAGMNYQVAVSGKPGPSIGRSLVIPRDAADLKSMADAEEDLNVMARLLDKAVTGQEGRGRHAMGILVHSPFEASGTPRNLYLEGYGAIFFLSVNCPLSPPPPNTEEAEAKPETPSEWDEARRELYQPPQNAFEFKWPSSGSEFKLAEPFGSGAAEDYDAEKVEDLKQNLAAALKNASHIRNLKANETVTIVVTGRNPVESKSVKRKPTAARAGAGTSPARPKAEIHGNQMVIRAARADIESFQDGKLSLDDFRKKISTVIY